MIFNVGARRSGTLWLQRVVAAHPDVAAIPTESHLFSHGIAPLLERFHHGARSSPQLGALYVDREVLLDAAREFCDRIFGELLDPGKRYLAERTPLHVLHLDLIGSIYPDASYVHIIRDGRDVARSLVSQSWGPETIVEAAEEWRDSVAAARAARPERYLELRYEELLARPRESVHVLYDWLGLEITDPALEAALAEAAASANLDPRDRRIQAAKWRTALTPQALADFDRVAGSLLAELGYPDGAGDAAREGKLPAPGTWPGGSRALRRLPRRVSRRARDVARSAGGRVRRPEDRWTEHDVHEAQAAFDRLLGHLHSGRHDELDGLLDERAWVTLVDRHRRQAARDPASRERALAQLSADPGFSGRQLRGDVHLAPPVFTAVLEYEDDGGGRADRVVVARLRGGRVRSLTVYRLDPEA